MGLQRGKGENTIIRVQLSLPSYMKVYFESILTPDFADFWNALRFSHCPGSYPPPVNHWWTWSPPLKMHSLLADLTLLLKKKRPMAKLCINNSCLGQYLIALKLVWASILSTGNIFSSKVHLVSKINYIKNYYNDDMKVCSASYWNIVVNFWEILAD